MNEGKGTDSHGSFSFSYWLTIFSSSFESKEQWLWHRIRMDRRATHVGAFEVFVHAHVASRMLAAILGAWGRVDFLQT